MPITNRHNLDQCMKLVMPNYMSLKLGRLFRVRAGYFINCLPCPKDTCPVLWVQYYKPEIHAKYYLQPV